MNRHLLNASLQSPGRKEPYQTQPDRDLPERTLGERATGIVQKIDLVGRDMTVQLTSGSMMFDIPPDCPILLHGEPIKLRMVQPRDHVCIVFTRLPERATAARVEVQPNPNHS
jgi:hypothetical protein